MGFTLAEISTGKQNKPPRIVLIGVEKIGKSTFGAAAPAPIFIQAKGETGLDEIDAARFPVCEWYEDMLACLEALATDGHQYKTLVLDSMSTLMPLMLEYACRKAGFTLPDGRGDISKVTKLGGGYGGQEDVIVNTARMLMDSIDYLRDTRGMGCVLICHIKSNPKTFNDPETDPYDTYKVEMRESVASAMFRWADAILFATFKKYTKETKVSDQKKIVHATGVGERVMYTEKRPAFVAGNRYGLPFELAFSYQAFADAFAAKR